MRERERELESLDNSHLDESVAITHRRSCGIRHRLYVYSERSRPGEVGVRHTALQREDVPR